MKLKKYMGTVGTRADGRPIKKAFYGITVAQAKQKAAEYIKANGGPEKRCKADEYTFAGWARQWLLVYKQPTVTAKAYYTTYESIVYQHLLPFFGDKLLVDITPTDVQKFYAEKSELSPSMCSKIQMDLNAIFETAIFNDRCYKNPAKFSVLKSKRAKKVKEVYDDEEIITAERWFMSHMPEVVLILETGARRGEMAGWQENDFDLKRKYYRIERSIILAPGSGPQERPPKCNSYRINPLSNIAVQAYKACIDLYGHGPYIVHDNGQPINPEAWSRRLKTQMQRFEKETGVHQLTAHILRHTYGTYLRRHGADIYTIAKVLGHRSIDVTSNTYVHSELSALRKAMKFINQKEL